MLGKIIVIINTSKENNYKYKNKIKDINITKNKYSHFPDSLTTSRVFRPIPYRIVNKDCLTDSHSSYS
jgi:DNA modification methylase